MRGFMDFLFGGAPEAEAALQRMRWLLVPMLNPDGVASGRTRTNLEGVDLNRHHHDNIAPETRGLRVALQEEVRLGPEPLAFVDIHSHSRRRGVFFIANGHDSDRLVDYLAARTSLLDAEGTNRLEVRPQDEGVGRVAGMRLGYRYSVTLESSLAARHASAGAEHLSLEDLQSVGNALCGALLDVAKFHDESADLNLGVAPPKEAQAAATEQVSTEKNASVADVSPLEQQNAALPSEHDLKEPVVVDVSSNDKSMSLDHGVEVPKATGYVDESFSK
jgi:hypothetical protein